MSIEQLIDKYIAIRGEIDVAEETIRNKKRVLQEVQAQLLELANSMGVSAFTTPSGTAFLDRVDYVTVANWDDFFQHIQETQSFQFLHHAANKTAVKEYIEENGAPPPGVNYTVKREIKVRKK